MKKKQTSRREFMKTTAKGEIATSIIAGFPSIVPSSVFGKSSPGNRINVGAIGAGRSPAFTTCRAIWQYDNARIIAVCDLDSKRVEDAKDSDQRLYAKKSGKPYDGVTGYSDFRELLNNNDIDAVVISTPDHWHAVYWLFTR